MNIRHLVWLAVLTAAVPLSAIAAISNADLEKSAQSPTKKATYPRVGETLDALTERYGPGKKNAGKIRIPGKDEYYWEMKGFGFNVVIEDGKAVMLVIHRINHMIAKADVSELLRANDEGGGWRPDPKVPRWVSNDNQLEAFREKKHVDMFFIQDVESVAKSGRGAVPGER